MTSRNTQDLSPWTMTNLTIFCWVFSFLGFKKKDIRDKTFWVSSSRITPEVVDQSATKAPKIDVFTKHSPFSKGSFHVFFGYLKVAFLLPSGFWVGEKTTSWSNLYLIPPHCVKILIPPTPNNPWCVHRFASCAHPSEGILRSEFLTMAMKGCFVWIFLGKKVRMQTFYHGQHSLPTKTMGKLQLQSNHSLFNRKFLQVYNSRQFVQ